MNRPPINRRHNDALVYERANTLTCAGLGLSAIADLLGADGSEHHLHHELESGLANAAKALAILVQQTGCELCDQFDPDPLNAPTED